LLDQVILNLLLLTRMPGCWPLLELVVGRTCRLNGNISGVARLLLVRLKNAFNRNFPDVCTLDDASGSTGDRRLVQIA